MQADMVSIDNQFPQAFDQSIKPLLAHYAIDAPDIMISDLVLDSREVAIHKAFIAIKGHSRDGRDFIPQAVSLGAKVILAECDTEQEHGNIEMREQSIIIAFYQLVEKLSQLAGYFFQFPANSMSVVAVTGTNGKTSIVQLTSQLASLLGEKVASIGTLGSGVYRASESEQALHTTINTTPDAISMQRLMAEYIGEGVYQVALEASSHALVQNRIKAVKTDVAIFTNLSRDHLDYHGSMSEYAAAKRQLLTQPELSYAVINAGDIEHKNWLAEVPSTVSVVLYGQDINPQSIAKKYKYCLAKNVQYTSSGLRLTLQSSWGDCEMRLALMGQFNVANILAAISAQLCLGKSLKQIAYVAQKLTPVVGRMELFSQHNRATIVVDYAHTPDALEKALQATRQHCAGKLFCIFGCGGDRDTGKRSLMGEIAEQLADHVVLTDDNVRSEDPKRIVQDILSGCRNPEVIKVEHDRKRAIQLAADLAVKGDMILLAGKGHETYQIVGNQTVAYDERQYVATFQKGKTI
ncbi:UDP-N-acetylmuramoyl-L-alanyl-D-glutamate--2,6-diaminopimelate ligase [Paraglaciecola aquimarina]|uniref:UDP-N-acetylmuramyl-tripeptide synthetase n=1 Tax=Paraglaciecola aquimarina TaxID=1235557 RepID=A0ABU3T2G3_9ALTE|nr:UDP-N-acetylmuramoyl-L-alanyl-D-glutamate--2,6-diaminopimelate ligase [Paraglaciecola aquimarina]MDU0356456.1 UDP-N-acetylmuramoyl-L-alanyl-D-glutamate--2,6-diaminopimelate ligase [Paraglaciecola aquimarina]